MTFDSFSELPILEYFNNITFTLMKKILILILVFILFPALSQAAGIQISPSKMDFMVEIGGEPVFKELVVVNPTADVQVFEVYPDEFSEIIKANPASFTLEAGARKIVIVKIDPAKIEGPSKILRTNFSILGKPLIETRLQTNTGVKIPLSVAIEHIIIENESNKRISPRLFYAILIVVALGFGSITHLIFNKKRNDRPKLEN